MSKAIPPILAPEWHQLGGWPPSAVANGGAQRAKKRVFKTEERTFALVQEPFTGCPAAFEPSP